ncbi:VOC family protein [Virgibacillus byunsanensis]|uniref:VOC family protein n=1 Tax=Virgibacillus byunsanensis TaxID=570945 RepID=A0ABW3LUG2_9BACI
MKIKVTSVFVDDQERAHQFYTEVLGFIKKTDIPAGDFKWLTVVSPEDPEGVELLLEPNENPAAKTYQNTIYEEGIPTTSFAVDDIQKEYERLKNAGVKFTTEPTEVGPVTFAIFDDTCGNLIQISQV